MEFCVSIDDRRIELDELLKVIRGARVELSDNPEWVNRICRSREILEEALEAGKPVYGVTTGVGYSSGKSVADGGMYAFASSIVHQHGCGVGSPLSRIEARAVVCARLVSLSKGYSAVRIELLQALADLLNYDVIPVIPRYGSVGASGDLTPLSYVVAVLAGDREAYFEGEILPAADALKRAGLQALSMIPKEQLAIMNGTSVMTAIGIVTADRLKRTIETSEETSALATEVMYGRSQAFSETAHKVKPHPGQLASAEKIRTALDGSEMLDRIKDPDRIIQDPYSLRCAPQVFGAVRDSLSWIEDMLRGELNSVNDNPIVDPDDGQIVFAGNFYGGHVALAMDLLKIAATSAADLLDRQFALLVDSRFNMGLPETLVGYGGNGAKALQITASALAAVAVQRSGSDTVLSRPTEVNNQDKVSMGLNAALSATEIVDLLQQILATEMIALSNASTLRDESLFSPAGKELLKRIREYSPVLVGDRRLDREIEALVADLDAIRL